MKQTVKEIAKSQVEVTVVYDGKEWEEAQKKAFDKVASKISVPGFRPGKAPKAMLAARVEPAKVIDQAINDCVSLAYGYALRESKLRPYGQPGVEVTKVDDKAVEYVFHLTLIPEVKLGAYKGLKAERKVASVSEEEVAEEINKLLAGNAELVVVEREAKMGDTVVLDFKGFVDGKAFEGGEAKNYSLELGSGSFIPGFEEALVGMKAEEEKDIDVTFPEQYVAELAGKPATFKCTIHEVKEKKIPVLDDEAVKDLGIKEVETVEALKEHEKAELLKRKEDEAAREHYEAIVTQIIDGSEVTIADSIVAQEAAHNEEQTKKQVESNGLTFQQYLEITGQTEEALKESIRKQAEANLKSYLVMEELCIKEHLLVDDAELDHEFAKMAEQYKMKLEDVKAAFSHNIEGFRDNLRQKKLQDFILANND